MKRLIIIIILGFSITLAQASSVGGVRLKQPHLERRNKASLKRGAKTYLAYCLTCHSLQYMRYNGLAQMLDFPTERGQMIKLLRQETLLPQNAKPSDAIITPLASSQARTLYGVVPPDLSLKAREKGVAWLNTYLLNFYEDKSRPSGVNNLIVPNTGMPNILGPLQGVQQPRFAIHKTEIDGKMTDVKEISGLKLVQIGSLSHQEFDETINDLVNFLDYVSEPAKQFRINLGVWVVLFLIIFAIITYFLKQVFWTDVH